MNHAHAILVVDDNAETRDAAEDICRNLGFRVVCVGSQEEALAALEDHALCGCMLDLELPTRPSSIARIEVGWGTLERIQAARPPKDFPVVVMTAHGSDHRFSATATLNEAAAFLKKPFGLPGEPPAEEILKRVLRRTCEARFPERCPNLDAEPKSKVKAGAKSKKNPRVARAYKGTVRIHLDGRRKDRRGRIEVDSQEKWVRDSTFEILWRLAVALRTSPTETMNGRDLGEDYNHALSRAKRDLEVRAGLDPELIENDGNKGYRLSIPPDHVTCDEASVRTRYPNLVDRVPWR